jgi:hypothetical protein
MAIEILKHEGTGAQLKFGLTEQLGINISRFTVKYYPEINDTLPGVVGTTKWRVMSANLSRDVECEGEIMTNTGVMAFTLGAVITFANSVTHFTGTAGSFYLDEATVTATRGGWTTVSIKASAKATL